MPLHSVTDLSDLTGMSRERVSRKLRDLPYETGYRNARMYNSIQALPMLYEFNNEAVDLNMARAKLAQKQVQKIDFDMEMKSGNFIPYDIMLAAAQRIFVAFRTRVCSIPTKIAPKVAAMDDPIDVEELLEDHLNEALDELNDLGTFIEQFGPRAADRGGKGTEAS